MSALFVRALLSLSNRAEADGSTHRHVKAERKADEGEKGGGRTRLVAGGILPWKRDLSKRDLIQTGWAGWWLTEGGGGPLGLDEARGLGPNRATEVDAPETPAPWVWVPPVFRKALAGMLWTWMEVAPRLRRSSS